MSKIITPEEARRTPPRKIIDPKDDRCWEEIPLSPTDMVLKKRLLAALHRRFPGASTWLDPYDNTRSTAWLIEIRSFPTGGVVTVRNLWISPRMGVTIKMKHTHEEIEQQVLYYAAELFERYNVARQQSADMRDKLVTLKRDFRGEAVHQ